MMVDMTPSARHELIAIAAGALGALAILAAEVVRRADRDVCALGNALSEETT